MPASTQLLLPALLPRATLGLATLAVLTAACDGASPSGGAGPSGTAVGLGAPPSPRASASATSMASTVASAASAASPSVGAAVSAKASAAAAPKADPKVVAKAVVEGRAKVGKKDLEGGLAAFEAGLAGAPKDGTLLAEAAWTAFRLDKLERAADYAKRGLAATGEGELRARILYTAGRIAEAKGDKAAARESYAASLALREDAEVKKRLEGVGGVREETLACSDGAASLEALCTCLLAKADELMNPTSAKATCEPVKEPRLGTPALAVVGFGAPSDEPGERKYVLVAHDGPVHRVVAELGHDFVPGAFGVDNDWSLLGAETKAVAKREVVVVRSKVANHDSNLAGLESCQHDVAQETVCAMGDANRPTRCVLVPMVTESGCGAGAEPDPSDLDSKALLEERKRAWSKAKAVLAWSVEADGSLLVQRVSGDAKLVSAGTLGPHPLFLTGESKSPAK
jgi:hypothetical protein